MKTQKTASPTLAQVPKILLWLTPFIVLWVNNLTLYDDLFDKAFLFNALTEIAFFIVLLLWLTGRLSLRLRFNLIDLLFTLFVFTLILATLFAYDPAKSFWGIFWRNDGLYQWLHYFLFYWLLRSLCQSAGDFWTWLKANSLAAGLLSAAILFLAFQQFFTIGSFPTYTVGSLSNFNFLAYYLSLSLVATLGLLFWLPKTRWRSLYLISFLLQFYPLWLTSGRTAYLATLVGIVVLLLARFWSQIKARRSLRGLLAACVVAFLIFMLGGFSRFGVKFTEVAVVHRFEAWKIGWEAFRERPVFGWGPENFSAAFNYHYRPVFEDEGSSNETWFDKAHNIFVEYFTTAGFLGGVAYLLLLTALFWRIVRFLRVGDKGRRRREDWAGLTQLALALLVVHLVLDFFGFDVIASTMVVVFLFALVASLGSGGLSLRAKGRRAKPLTKGFWALPLALVLLLISSQYTWRPWLIEKAAAAELKVIKRETFQQELDQIEKTLQKSSFIRRNFLPYIPLGIHQSLVKLEDFSEEEKRRELWPAINEMLYRYRDDLKKEPTSLLAVALSMSGDMEVDEATFKRVSGLLQEIMAINPNRPYLWYYLAHLYSARGDNERAYELLLKALSLNDKFDLARHQLVLTSWALGDIEASDEFASQAQTLETLNNLAQFYAQNREFERLLKIYQRLLERNPQDVPTRYRLGVLEVQLGHLAEARKEAEELKKDRRHPEAQVGAYDILRLIEEREKAQARE